MKSIAALCAILFGLLAFGAPSSFAYSASQAEALSDPAHVDPYTFPNIKWDRGASRRPVHEPVSSSCSGGGCGHRPAIRPCWQRPTGCRAPHKRPVISRPTCHQSGGCHDDGHPPHDDYPERDVIVVRCDGSGEFRSLQEAVNAAGTRRSRYRDVAKIQVVGGYPGPACQGNVIIEESLEITGTSDADPRARAEVRTGYGPCVTVRGPATEVLISNLDFQSEGGPACMLVENARLQLNNVRINAPRSAAGIKGYDARVGAAGLWVFAGGPAVAASRTAVVLNNASIGTNGDVTFAPDAYGTEPSFRDAPIRYLAEDPDAPYMGGGNPGGYYPPVSGYPVPGYPAPGYPPNGYAQPGYPGTPGPHDVPPPNGYPELPPPGAQIYPPDRAVPSVRPSFSGTPALFLDDSRADLTSVYVRGGSHGIAGFLSGAYPDRGITLRGVTITAASGSHGILAIQTGGFGQASGVVTAGGVYIQGFKTGIELQGTNSRIYGVVMRDVRKGLVTDAHTTGEANTNQIAYGDECRCIAGDCGRGDVTTARFRFRGNVCND